MVVEKKDSIDAFYVASYIIIAIVLGFSFFLFFINLYHMNEVNTKYIKSNEELVVSQDIKKEISIVENKLNNVDLTLYMDKDNYELLSDTATRLNSCVNILKDEKLYDSMDKKEMSMLDIYKFQEDYENIIVNECLVKQLYGISNFNNKEDIMNRFIKSNIDTILTDVSYVKNNLLSNSSYYFTTNSAKVNVFDLNKESYYQIISSYRKSVNFVDMITDWYINSLGGN